MRKNFFLLASTASIIVTAGFINAPAQAQVKIVRGNKYEFYTTLGSFDTTMVLPDLMPWFGSQRIALEFADAYGTAREFAFFPYAASSASGVVDLVGSDLAEYQALRDSLLRYAIIRQKRFDGIYPINNGSVNITGNLDESIQPIFKGGTLKVDQSYTFGSSDFKFPQNFTLDQDGTIDANGKTAYFTGAFTGAGALSITNSGDQGFSGSKITIASSSNRILLGGLTTAPSNSTGGGLVRRASRGNRHYRRYKRKLR